MTKTTIPCLDEPIKQLNDKLNDIKWMIESNRRVKSEYDKMMSGDPFYIRDLASVGSLDMQYNDLLQKEIDYSYAIKILKDN